jgi:hypothetical protein
MKGRMDLDKFSNAEQRIDYLKEQETLDYEHNIIDMVKNNIKEIVGYEEK